LAATRLSATQLALPCWLKLSVVRPPTLNELQFRIACGAVCWMPTWVWPLASTLCVGVVAPVQLVTGLATLLPANPESGTSPPGARPLATLTCGNVVELCEACAATR